MGQTHPYIWQQPDWPGLHFDLEALAGPLLQARREQGVVLGQAQAIGLTEIDEVREAIWID